MGRDKALLPHPEGGTWLERSLGLLAQLERPITLLSRHSAHLELAAALPQVTPIAEPAPWEGPLLALHRLMQRHPDQRLLLCPVDMPELSLAVLRQLVAAAAQAPQVQPLLGVYPSSIPLRQHLAASINSGERRLQSWLLAHPFQAVPLDPRALRNVNRPDGGRPDFNGTDFNGRDVNRPNLNRANTNRPERDQPSA